MQLGEIVVHIDNYNFTKFHQNQMKNKKVLLIARVSVQNFKVSVESCAPPLLIFFDKFDPPPPCTMYNFHDSTDTLKF